MQCADVALVRLWDVLCNNLKHLVDTWLMNTKELRVFINVTKTLENSLRYGEGLTIWHLELNIFAAISLCERNMVFHTVGKVVTLIVLIEI